MGGAAYDIPAGSFGINIGQNLQALAISQQPELASTPHKQKIHEDASARLQQPQSDTGRN